MIADTRTLPKGLVRDQMEWTLAMTIWQALAIGARLSSQGCDPRWRVQNVDFIVLSNQT